MMSLAENNVVSILFSSSSLRMTIFVASLQLVLSSNRPDSIVSAGVEETALLKWRNSLDNRSQSILQSWGVVRNPCNWIGIGCDSAGRVSQLNLSYNGIIGTLHDLNFSSLPHLRRLNFYRNSLQGNVPSIIGNLSNLNYPDLSRNNFSGIIPPELGLLINLQLLYMDSNHFSGPIPQGITNMKFLYDVNFGNNMLTGSIPTDIGNLTGLNVSLGLYSNELTGQIPASVLNLTMRSRS